MSEESKRKIFEQFVPEGAVNYCFSLWQELGFDFKITRDRQSKYGDYRFDPRNGKHSISVNHGLNKFAFLVTYIHEVAHKTTHDLHQNKVNPHGREWKMQFKKLMLPMLREDIFPMDVLAPLARHMKNPKATSSSDSKLFEALRKHDSNAKNTLLKDISIGQKFLFRKKVYIKLNVQRTRALCELSESGRKYLISESAPVDGFKNS